MLRRRLFPALVPGRGVGAGWVLQPLAPQEWLPIFNRHIARVGPARSAAPPLLPISMWWLLPLLLIFFNDVCFYYFFIF